MIHNKIIAVDYDGTCTTKNDFPNVGEIRDGLKYCVDRLKENGNVLILWTCRHDEKLEEAKNHLIENGIEFTHKTNGEPIDGYCTFNNAKRILGRVNHLTLADLAEECGYYLHAAHNAYNDVWAEVAIFTYLKKIEAQKGEN